MYRLRVDGFVQSIFSEHLGNRENAKYLGMPFTEYLETFITLHFGPACYKAEKVIDKNFELGVGKNFDPNISTILVTGHCIF